MTATVDRQPGTESVATTLRGVLDGRWAEVRQQAREQLPPPEPVHELTGEQHREHVWRGLSRLAESGHARLGFPESVGGSGDVGGSVVSFMMLGYGDLSLMVKAGVQWGLFGGAVEALGTERHHQRWLRPIMELELPGCFAMTETGHGSDVQQVQTTATYDPVTREFVVHTPVEQARKDYIGNAARDGRMAAVFAQVITPDGVGHGVHALLVPIRDADGTPCAGVTITDCGVKAGLAGVDNGRLSFDRVRVPRENLLDRFGSVSPDGVYSSPIENENRRFFTQLGTLVRGRISVAAGSISATQLALTVAVRYAESRTQFSAPGSDDEVTLLDYRAHQRVLLPALATTYAMHFAEEELIATLHDLHGVGEQAGDVTEHAQRELEARAAGIKAAATEHATRTIQAARQACGGAGYLAVNRLPGLKADTDVFTTFEGDNTVLRQLVAKGLLTQYRDHLGELDTLGTVRFVADQVFDVVVERTAARGLLQRLVDAVPGRDEDVDLLDRGWHVRLFEDREKHLLDGLARRLRPAAKAEPAEAFRIFNDAQDHLLLAAIAHIERVVLEAFVAAVDRCPEGAARRLLDRVCDLHVLSRVEADRGWFLEHGRITPARSKAITRAVGEACGELREHARTLVDAFGIPEAWIDAPIAAAAPPVRG